MLPQAQPLSCRRLKKPRRCTSRSPPLKRWLYIILRNGQKKKTMRQRAASGKNDTKRKKPPLPSGFSV
ncbi:hypothetical protein CHH63_03065, partial [Bacillus licheniformis]